MAEKIIIQSYQVNNINPLDYISRDKLEDIKTKDPKPYFRAYVIAHEGDSQPKVLNETSRKINWTKNAIKSVKNAIKGAVNFFLGHNKDNSTENRESVGQIIEVIEKEIDGKLQNIAIGYFPEKEKVKNLDICSIEAEVNLFEKAGHYVADSIEKLTGIALGSSNNEQPAFTGARVLGEIQCFENTADSGLNNNSVNTKKAESKMTFQEVKQAIADLNIFPSQLFGLEDLKNDRKFNPIFSDYETKTKKISDELETFKKQNEELVKKSTNYEKQVLKSTAKDRIGSIIKTNNITMTEKEQKFFDKQFEKLSDYSDEALNKFVTEAREQYKDIAGIFATETNANVNVNVETKDKNKDGVINKDNPFLTL